MKFRGIARLVLETSISRSESIANPDDGVGAAGSSVYCHDIKTHGVISIIAGRKEHRSGADQLLLLAGVNCRISASKAAAMAVTYLHEDKILGVAHN